MSRLTQRDRSITMLNIYKNPSSIIKGIICLYNVPIRPFLYSIIQQ